MKIKLKEMLKLAKEVKIEWSQRDDCDYNVHVSEIYTVVKIAATLLINLLQAKTPLNLHKITK